MASEIITETDVLIIGGGLSGIFAALKAREEGVDVTIVDKGYVGKSGSALYANNTSIFNPNWGHNLGDWMKQIAETGDYMNNPEMTEITLKESYERYLDLVDLGVDYPKENGELIGLPPHGVLKDYFTGRGTEWLPRLRNPVLKSGVSIIDRVMVTDLINQDGNIVGAVGFHIRTGDFYVFKAKAVIICTGGGTLSLSTYDGEAMAYRAGAEISGKEFSISGTGPFSYMGSGYDYYGDRKNVTSVSLEDLKIGKLPRFGASMFLDKYLDSEGNKVNRYTMLSAVHRGKAPFYWNPEDALPEDIEATIKTGGSTEITSGTYQVPIRLELYVGWAVHCAAGISSTDTSGGTSLPGLFGAGDGYNSRAIGAKYAHRGFGTRNAMVIGARAGHSAASYARETGKYSVDPENIARLKQSTYAPIERINGFDHEWVASEIRSITHSYYVWFIRHGDRLKAALTLIEFLKNHVTPLMYAVPRDTHGLRLAHETTGRLLSIEMMLRAAIFRTESRGVHYREDYPFRDDPSWLAEVKIRQRDGGMELIKEPFPEKWWPDLSKPYRDRYPIEYLGEESIRNRNDK